YWAGLDAVWRKLHTQAATRAHALTLRELAHDSRTRFWDLHAEAVYDRATDGKRKFVRCEELFYAVPAIVPGLAPTRAEVAAEMEHKQGDKYGAEILHGIMLGKFMAIPAAGRHLTHSMLLPMESSVEAYKEYAKTGKLKLARASVERRNGAAHVTMQHPDVLNAEDDSTNIPIEMAVDIAMMDPQSKVGILRGDTVQHKKYAGQRIFNAGINLTHLYWGKISYLFYITRDFGFVNKMLRGIARPDRDPSEIGGGTSEKVWIAAVDNFAIGGGCQLLLVMDYVLAAKGAYMTLPARKEGIIPGAANMRLPRFVGDRITRQAIMYERRLECDSPEGRMICDEIIPAGQMEQAIERVVAGLTSSGTVSAEGNRRAMRVIQEPLDAFRTYYAAYAREQAYCHFSPALISNLERHWDAQNRKVA
ncbi:MAG: enoyl-CoA hydratase/isomerase family protein, partial [Alphaproteobacteria bacterium]